MKKIYIYTLTDPRDNLIKYVGKTENLSKREYQHLTVFKRNKNSCWIKFLTSQNLKPIFEVLDIVDENTWKDSEIYWISQMKTWGFPLKNMTEGGESPDKELMSKIHKGKTISQEHKAKLVKANTGKKVSDETRAKLSKVLKGKAGRKGGFTASIETRKKQSESRLIKMGLSFPDKILCQYDINTEEFIKSYDTIFSAYLETNISRTLIANNALNRCLSAGGFVWKWVSKVEEVENKEEVYETV